MDFEAAIIISLLVVTVLAEVGAPSLFEVLGLKEDCGEGIFVIGDATVSVLSGI